MFSNVDPTRDRIILIEGDKIISRDEDVSKCFNNYFSNITDSLDIPPSFKEVHEDMAVDLTVDQMVEKAVEKYKKYPSIRRIIVKGQIPNLSSVTFYQMKLGSR